MLFGRTRAVDFAVATVIGTWTRDLFTPAFFFFWPLGNVVTPDSASLSARALSFTFSPLTHRVFLSCLLQAHQMSSSLQPGSAAHPPSSAAPKKVGLVLSSLPPKQQGFGKDLVSLCICAQFIWDQHTRHELVRDRAGEQKLARSEMTIRRLRTFVTLRRVARAVHVPVTSKGTYVYVAVRVVTTALSSTQQRREAGHRVCDFRSKRKIKGCACYSSKLHVVAG